MFAQANCEHCRHKIFNADWIIDGEPQPHSLFEMIRHTTEAAPAGVLSAYKDNAAVIEGCDGRPLLPRPATGVYGAHARAGPHPDEGRDPQPPDRHLALPGRGHRLGRRDPRRRRHRPRRQAQGGPRRLLGLQPAHPGRRAALGAGPRQARAHRLGARHHARGPARRRRLQQRVRPAQLCRLLPHLRAARSRRRTARRSCAAITSRSCSPAASATSAPSTSQKDAIPAGDAARRARRAGHAHRPRRRRGLLAWPRAPRHEDLDFASVQRDNAEMERRCQEVIDRCWALRRGQSDPLHPRRRRRRPLQRPARAGARRRPRRPLRAAQDAQRRAGHVAAGDLVQRGPGALRAGHRRRAARRASRRSARASAAPTPWSARRPATGSSSLDGRALRRRARSTCRCELLLGKPPRMHREVTRVHAAAHRRSTRAAIDLRRGDRARAAPARRWPTRPSSSPSATAPSPAWWRATRWSGPGRCRSPTARSPPASYDGYTGEAMAMGERTPLALLDAAASARMAVGEALTNIAAAPHRRARRRQALRQLDGRRRPPGRGRAPLRRGPRRRAWSCARRSASPSRWARTRCRMRTVWQDATAQPRAMTAPLSLIVSAFAPVTDVRRTLTPAAAHRPGRHRSAPDRPGARQEPAGRLVPGAGLRRSSATTPPGPRRPGAARALLRRDPGAERARACCSPTTTAPTAACSSTLCEMAFAGRLRARRWTWRRSGRTTSRRLFSEELGAVIQVRARRHRRRARRSSPQHGLGGLQPGHRHASTTGDAIRVRRRQAEVAARRSRARACAALWSETSFAHAGAARQPGLRRRGAGARIDADGPGPATPSLTFDPDDDIAAPFMRARRAAARSPSCASRASTARSRWPRPSTAPASTRVDVHMTDLLDGRVDLDGFRGPGGLRRLLLRRRARRRRGLGQDRSSSTPRARDQFQAFFARADTFTLGVCNGCQMLSNLHELIPGAEHWPRFVRNRSEQFEARAVAGARSQDSPSVLLRRHGGLAHAHRRRARRGPRRVRATPRTLAALERARLVAARYRGQRRPRRRALPGQPQRLAAAASPRSPRPTAGSPS